MFGREEPSRIMRFRYYFTKKISFIRRRLRLEFNQNHVDYYTELDAVYLHGIESEEEYFGREDSVNSLSDIFGEKIALNSIHDGVHDKQEALNILMLPVRTYSNYAIDLLIYQQHIHACGSYSNFSPVLILSQFKRFCLVEFVVLRY